MEELNSEGWEPYGAPFEIPGWEAHWYYHPADAMYKVNAVSVKRYPNGCKYAKWKCQVPRRLIWEVEVNIGEHLAAQWNYEAEQALPATE